MAIYKTTKLIPIGNKTIIIPNTITLRTSYITTAEDNNQPLMHLTTPLFERACDTRLNYLPHNPHYKHNKYRKRKFKIKPYNSMVFKDIPFNLHWGED